MKHVPLMLAAAALSASFSALAAADPLPQYTPAIPAQGGYNPPKPKEGFRYPDCFCTDSAGQRIEIGKTTCLQIGSQQVLARCAMSLNNPTWRRLQEGCPSV